MKHILVALDASPRARGVLGTALQLATLADAKLILYRAVGIPQELPRERLDLTDQGLEASLIEEAQRDLEGLAMTIDASRVELVFATFATAWDGICREARSRDVDLVVVGAQGYGRLDRLLGTTAAKVVNHIDRNLLVVRGDRALTP